MLFCAFSWVDWLPNYACIFENSVYVFKWIYITIFVGFMLLYALVKADFVLFVYIICPYVNLVKTCVIYAQFLRYTCS